ncbi:ATP-binding cassette domain-containing protein [Nonomuraea sp. NPDC050663]|uniref:ABC transporter ATP-binding protein n=1 Tax=Nonomuraea sp. NPDC050663 TaxID=3364370 RepID=UPI0037BB9EF6
MQLSNVSFSYRRRGPSVLRDVGVRLAPGDVIEVVGANGAGKSTLLRLLAGITRPTGGTILDRPSVVGFAPDRFPADQPFTVAGYLTHLARVRGTASWKPWCARLGLDPLLSVRLGELSKGSAHKVGLVQALMCAPGLLILDEPFAGLDVTTRDALPAIIAEVRARSGIVVASDHQGGLQDVPSVRRWSVVDGRVKEGSAEPAMRGSGDADSESRATVRVTLPADEADAFVAKMRQAGYEAER